MSLPFRPSAVCPASAQELQGAARPVGPAAFLPGPDRPFLQVSYVVGWASCLNEAHLLWWLMVSLDCDSFTTALTLPRYDDAIIVAHSEITRLFAFGYHFVFVIYAYVRYLRYFVFHASPL